VISNNHIHNNTETGLDVLAARELEITGNTISENNHAGIYLNSCHRTKSLNNTIENNKKYGLLINSSVENTVRDNTFVMNGISIFGFDLEEWRTHTIENNMANGRPIYYYKDQAGVTVPSDAASVILANCTQCFLTGLDLSDTDFGVQMAYSFHNTISGCLIRSNKVTGIRLHYHSPENLIKGNIIADHPWEGILIYDACHNNSVKRNTLTGNDRAIFVRSDNNIIEDNSIIDNNEGLSVVAGSGNRATGNIIVGNRYGPDGYGILLYKCVAGTVLENILSDNKVGLLSTETSINNHIFHNSFVLNDTNASDECINTWHDGYPSGGNYWDDYLGEDLNGDGIGDSPYTIQGGGNQDLYPLMSPFGRCVLYGDRNMLSVDEVGQVSFTLVAGKPEATRNYLLLASASGTSPGTPLPGGMVTLPLNWDILTSYVMLYLNSPAFMDFMGALDGEGMGYAQFDSLVPLSPAYAGLTLSFAYALNTPWDAVSNPMNVEVIP
jgi:parallel beta-helix repeat protein